MEKSKEEIEREKVVAKKIWYKRWYVIVFLVLGFIFMVKVMGGNYDSSTTTIPDPQKATRERETISIVFAKDVIRKTLKAPSTAKFVDVQAYELSNEKDVWAVNGYVDSQNSFGAMIRSQWEVQLDYRDGKNGTVKSIFFDGEKML
ncbi:hypothetical protein A2643_02920 [Candidatus Nomurabacteria bacterium RIFCSPHIGHO2_01_FULL_39_220]|uniref:Uncharacterized protein n=1 Tax=Candidatus Nomurabacteria bacterium RIFCSPLOWO2_02_FULL_40_67 TaxID=1801787 RepID=A0A1F6Y654_9BACT|nr:MAG: hypothetical protein UU01_C0018G0007 [Parcubacteria group bacterium GW2011_GWA2_40_37]OGI70168.1 MAG: hypothetical protein A2643_02920 [Candidatus Nomurabacteria bacterium RIFCSPHIGHO2_01_FULL_39_220]OGI72389.1 MAG: hypothetical protein A2W56_03325 [Candidatus Nomurabacteria bacterium RIFCSPHIGHO2_02_41_18]OGI78633.1 MAG: hypothetical protein A3C65_02575 [Candidatus Nomurabacteria bacterium RIFCSPHIGHO2_02_FULL_41_150]OGI81690.1 MAG: hypothetical protein A3E03_04140 [Candidatus Nomuraba